MSNKKDLDNGLATSEELEKLSKALEASENTVSEELVRGSALKIEDLTEMANKYLSEKAKQDLSKKATQTAVFNEDGLKARAVYFATQVKTNNQLAAVEKLAKIINDLADKNLIYSTLAPISSLELVRLPLKAPSCAVMCFLLIPANEADYIEEQYKDLTVKEGEMPRPMDDLTPELADGEFLAEYKISHALTVMKDINPDQMLQEYIDLCLKILPKGTIVKDIVKCAVIGLSVDHEIKFYNPLMKRVKYIDFGHIRCAEVIDNKVEQFSLMVNVKYFDNDMQELFGGLY